MNNEKMQEDISWIRQLAEDGRNAPLSGGSISIWWAVLTSAMMLIHWATLSGYMPFSIAYIGFGWISYAVIGFIGTMVLAKKIKKAGGGNSIGDRVSSASWAMFGAGITSFFIGCVLAVFVVDSPYWLFNLLLPVAFIGYGIAHGVTAMIARKSSSGRAAILSFVLATLMMLLLTNPAIYLLAAIGVLLVILPPAINNRAAKS